eukprot:GSChrysophyteH1.ASY1.ANO1.718.1 assembled CDS
MSSATASRRDDASRKGSLSPKRKTPETNEKLELTPTRGSRASSRSTSVRERDDDSLSPIRGTKSPVVRKGKLDRSYEAPSSPGKSPRKVKGGAAKVHAEPSDDDDSADVIRTPVTSPSRAKRLEQAALVTPSSNAGGIPTKIQVTPRTDKVYGIVRQCTGTLGGNGTTGAIYGELTMGSMQKIINLMVEKCELNDQSRFIDVGSGLGKPNFHAAQDPQCRLSVGIELEKIRWQLSMYNLKKTLEDTARETPLLGGVNFMVGDIDDAASTDPFTHIYMYDLGFPPPLQKNIAEKFNDSQYAQYLISYRPPRRVISEYGYRVEFVTQMTTSMHGSGENHMAYFYKRISPIPRITPEIRSNLAKVHFPARPGFDEKSEDILCDKSFEKCVSMAVGDVATLEAYATRIVNTQLLTSERPVRERRPRRLFE